MSRSMAHFAFSIKISFTPNFCNRSIFLTIEAITDYRYFCLLSPFYYLLCQQILNKAELQKASWFEDDLIMSPSTIDKMFEIYTFFENTTEIYIFFSKIGPKFTLFSKIGSKFILAFCSKIGPKISNILSMSI